MTADRHFDVIVVGNGAVGASIAHELGERGRHVARVGPVDRDRAASTAAGAMLGCFGEVTKGMLASEHGRAKLDLDYRARDMWTAWDDRLSERSGDERSLLSAEGTFVLLNTVGSAAVDTASFRAIEQTLQDFEEKYEHVDPEELDWLSPNHLYRSLRGLFIPGEHAVDSHRLLRKLDSAFAATGGSLFDDHAHGLVIDGGRVTGVRLRGGEVLHADQVVLAAGALSLELMDSLPELRRRIPPMVSGYGVSALVETEDRALPNSVVRTPNRAFACGLHCVPRGDGMLYLGATNIISEEPRRHAALGDLQFLLDCAVDQLHTNLAEAALHAVQVGNRPVPVDGFPLLGSTGADGLWLATGTYRDGLHQSPLLARHIADLLDGKDSDFGFLNRFQPVRAPLHGGTREEIVTTAVEHMMATGYESKWHVIPEWPPRMERHLRSSYTTFVEEFHPEFTPPAELVAAMTDRIAAALQRYYREWSS